MVKGDRKKGAEDTHMVTYMVMMKNHEYKLVKRGEKTESIVKMWWNHCVLGPTKGSLELGY